MPGPGIPEPAGLLFSVRPVFAAPRLHGAGTDTAVGGPGLSGLSHQRRRKILPYPLQLGDLTESFNAWGGSSVYSHISHQGRGVNSELSQVPPGGSATRHGEGYWADEAPVGTRLLLGI